MKFPAVLPRHGHVLVRHEHEQVRVPLNSLSHWERWALRALLRDGVEELSAGLQPRGSRRNGERVWMRIETHDRDEAQPLWVPLWNPDLFPDRPDINLSRLYPESSKMRWDLV